MQKHQEYYLFFESIEIGESYGAAWVLFGTLQDSWLELSFGSLSSKNRPSLISQASSSVFPEGFDQEISENRLSCAIRWILRLDAFDKRRYLDGAIIRTQIPLKSKPPLPTFSKPTKAETYWRLRQPAGSLVRPILLQTPSQKKLYKYQKEGVERLLNQHSIILADDMGLGKTIQAIISLRLLFNAGEIQSALIICPKTLLANWEEELTTWAPELSRVRMISSASQQSEAWSAIFNRVHILLVNYEQLRNSTHELKSVGVGVVIADEAHRMRKLSSKITKGIREIKYKRFWALTGTPIERDAKDFATLLSTIQPHRFAPSDSKLAPSILRSRAKPYILRRTKEAVLKELPDVLEIMEVLELHTMQRKSYNRAIREASSKPGSTMAFVALINQLRTICDYDPSSEKSSKINRIAEIVVDITKTQEKAVVFSYILKPLDILRSVLEKTIGSSAVLTIKGDTQMSTRQQILSKFKTDPTVSVLLASSRVVGEGLTLTEANHAIFINEWWNPSANAQARDRIVRIGQKRAVRVYKFVCKDTLEESLQKILKKKGWIYAEIIDKLADPANAGIIDDALMKDLQADMHIIKKGGL